MDGLLNRRPCHQDPRLQVRSVESVLDESRCILLSEGCLILLKRKLGNCRSLLNEWRPAPLTITGYGRICCLPCNPVVFRRCLLWDQNRYNRICCLGWLRPLWIRAVECSSLLPKCRKS